MFLPIGASPLGNGWGRRKVEQMHVSDKNVYYKRTKKQMGQKVRRGYVFANANSHQSGWGSLGMKTPPTSVVSMRVHRKSKLPAEALCFRIVLQPSPGVDCLRQINNYRDNVTIRI